MSSVLRMLLFVVVYLFQPANSFAGQVDYLQAVQPLLKDRCYRCHGSEKQKGGLRLDSKVSVLQGGDSGTPAIVHGHADQSLLFELVASSDDDERMPPSNAKEARLEQSELDVLK
ncbi:MAG: hypothetical protein HOH33_05915, partial [Verrucomicrobia bacterium]|nr:hypothetical protein [Verrucomicrobiota bacterium]